MKAPEQRVIVPVPASHSELGRLLWMLQDTRARTLTIVEGLDQAAIDWSDTGIDNSIGTLLYHLALIEADYLYADILGVDYPSWLEEAFPSPDRDDTRHLSEITGVPLAEHLARLKRVREEFLTLVAPLTSEQLAAGRDLPSANHVISSVWTLHHRMQHEAEHRGQITIILALRLGNQRRLGPDPLFPSKPAISRS